MESRVADTLEMLALEGVRNDALEGDPARKFLTLDPHTASAVSGFLRAAGARRILEIGTSVGYSTIWLAWSVRPMSGEVITLDRSAEKQTQARQNLLDAGLLDVVEFRCGDATEIVKTLSGPFDAVFFDADRVSAPRNLRYFFQSWRQQRCFVPTMLFRTRKRSPRISKWWNNSKASRTSFCQSEKG